MAIANRLLPFADRHARHGIVSATKNVTRLGSDCRYIYFTPQFLPILLAQKENVWPTYGMEWVLGDALREAKRQGMRFTFPPLVERTEGLGMTHGQDLSLIGRRLVKAQIKHALWKLLFDIGIFPLDHIIHRHK